MNNTSIIGRLTADPVLSYTANGAPVCNFSIAYNYIFTRDGEKTETVSFFRCVAWNKTADVICKYIRKGQRIGVSGRLQQRRWQDRETGGNREVVEIVVDAFDFIESTKNGGGENVGENVGEKAPSSVLDGKEVNKNDVPDQVSNNPFNDDDIPL